MNSLKRSLNLTLECPGKSWNLRCQNVYEPCSIKTFLRNSLGQENPCDLMLIACDGLLPKGFLPGLLISGCYLVIVVFTWTGTRKKFLNVLVKIKTSKCSAADFDYELAINMWKQKKACRLYKKRVSSITFWSISVVFFSSCYRYKWYAYI